MHILGLFFFILISISPIPLIWFFRRRGIPLHFILPIPIFTLIAYRYFRFYLRVNNLPFSLMNHFLRVIPLLILSVSIYYIHDSFKKEKEKDRSETSDISSVEIEARRIAENYLREQNKKKGGYIE